MTAIKLETVKQFVSSAVLGFFASVGYLLTAYELDKVVDYNVANIIGLAVDHMINFFLQYALFVRSGRSRWRFFIRFSLGNVTSIVFSQVIFMLVHQWVKCHRPYYYRHGWKRHVTLIRYLLGAVTYVLVSFPLRKWYMFRDDDSLFL